MRVVCILVGNDSPMAPTNPDCWCVRFEHQPHGPTRGYFDGQEFYERVSKKNSTVQCPDCNDWIAIPKAAWAGRRSYDRCPSCGLGYGHENGGAIYFDRYGQHVTEPCELRRLLDSTPGCDGTA